MKSLCKNSQEAQKSTQKTSTLKPTTPKSNQIGSYAYINPEGKEVRVSYTADSRGFRVLSNDLRVAPVANYLVVPFQVEDTPEDTQSDQAFPSVVSAPDVPDSYGKAAYEDFMENIDKESSYWVSPEGEKFSLTSATDEEEFKPKGAHLPDAPFHVYELPVAPVHEYELSVAPALTYTSAPMPLIPAAAIKLLNYLTTE